MPAVENSLGPCRKQKSTIYGWTLTNGNYISVLSMTIKKAVVFKGDKLTFF